MQKITPAKYEFLSNRYGALLEFEGKVYPTAENAFQASRFLSPDMRQKFAYMPSYHAAYCGQTFRTTVPDWREKQFDIMYRILQIKFSDRELAAKLKATGDVEIVMENKWNDNLYGVCTCYKCRTRGTIGENRLGKMLMQLREEI